MGPSDSYKCKTSPKRGEACKSTGVERGDQIMTLLVLILVLALLRTRRTKLKIEIDL
jgi:hypothetical protein